MLSNQQLLIDNDDGLNSNLIELSSSSSSAAAVATTKNHISVVITWFKNKSKISKILIVLTTIFLFIVVIRTALFGQQSCTVSGPSSESAGSIDIPDSNVTCSYTLLDWNGSYEWNSKCFHQHVRPPLTKVLIITTDASVYSGGHSSSDSPVSTFDGSIRSYDPINDDSNDNNNSTLICEYHGTTTIYTTVSFQLNSVDYDLNKYYNANDMSSYNMFLIRDYNNVQHLYANLSDVKFDQMTSFVQSNNDALQFAKEYCAPY